MTTRTITICDACGRDIEPLRRMWVLVTPMTDTPLHFHGPKCLEEFAQRELAKKPPPPLRKIWDEGGKP